jgi:hypothetical protein
MTDTKRLFTDEEKQDMVDLIDLVQKTSQLYARRLLVIKE